jgi:molybdopterin-guanine dinucleotide biosynthesis protein A
VAGIEAALDYLLTQDKTGILVVLPIDMSLLTAETLELLLSEAEPGQITRFKGHPMPMLIPITAAIHELVVNMLKNTTKERGIAIRALCDYVQCSTIPVIDERQSEFFNCNTRDDFQLLKTLTNEHAKDT